MENKIQSFKAIIDLYNVSEDGVKLSFVRTTNGGDYINSSYEKYFKITQIRKATPRDHGDKAIDIIFDGYFDEEAIARDEKKTEEDALVERITKAVLEKINDQTKNTAKSIGKELKSVGEKINNQQITIDLKIDGKEVERIIEESVANLKNLMEKPY